MRSMECIAVPAKHRAVRMCRFANTKTKQICYNEYVLQASRPSSYSTFFYDITQLVIAQPYGIAMDDASC